MKYIVLFSLLIAIGFALLLTNIIIPVEVGLNPEHLAIVLLVTIYPVYCITVLTFKILVTPITKMILLMIMVCTFGGIGIVPIMLHPEATHIRLAGCGYIIVGLICLLCMYVQSIIVKTIEKQEIQANLK